MTGNADLLTRFYTAFQRRDAEAMAACYHPEARFQDPVFGRLSHDEVCAMWRMLAGRAADLEITFTEPDADEHSGRLRWEARYTFTQTGRPVHNIIDALFGFHEGLIMAHRDTFNLWRWSRQALGPMGLVLGWSPLVQNKIRANARKALDAYMAKGSA